MLRSRAASLVVGARRAVGIRVARALALPARLSIELSRALQSMRGSIGIRLDIARRSVQPLTLRKPTARMTQAWKASGHRSLALGRVAVSTAQRFAMAAVIVTVIVTGMFAISGWDVPRALAPVETPPAAAVSLPPPNDAIAANATDRPSPNPPRREPRPTADPAPPVRRQPPPPGRLDRRHSARVEPVSRRPQHAGRLGRQLCVAIGRYGGPSEVIRSTGRTQRRVRVLPRFRRRHSRLRGLSRSHSICASG